jgi:hypothetical protein
MNRLNVVAKLALLVASLSSTVFAVDYSAQQPSDPPPTSLLGQPLSDAQQLEFFEFFRFSLSDDRPDPAHAGMSIKMFSVGGDYRGEVTLMISTKISDDTIQVAGLMIRRDFIDNPETALFARDVVKSFLELSPGSESHDLAKLHNEIWECYLGTYATQLQQRQDTLVPHSCEDTPENTPAYLVFLGQLEKFKILRSGGYVMLQNTKKVAGIPLLFVEMRNE